MTELATPKKTPTPETLVPSRKTPTKKPRVTRLHAKSTRNDGRAWRKIKDTATVNGRTNPRAT